jgi:antitoxin ParD1/3/4
MEMTKEEHAERLDAIRARIRRSLDDHRPNLSAEEMKDWIAGLKAAAHKSAGDKTQE